MPRASQKASWFPSFVSTDRLSGPRKRAAKSRDKRWASLGFETLEQRRMLSNIAIIAAGLGGMDFPAPSVIGNLESRGFNVYLAEWNSWNSTTFVLDNANGGDGKGESLLPESGDDPGSFGFNLATFPLAGVNVPEFPLKGTITLDLGSPNTSDGFVQEGLSLIEAAGPNPDVVLIGHSLGGDSVLRLAKAADQLSTPIPINVLALLDPVGFISGAPVTQAAQLLPVATSLATDGFASASLQVSNGVNGNEMENADGLFPGFRTGLGSVPNNVVHLFNRWQTNGMFPLDFKDSGQLQYSAPTIADQGVQNTTTPYRPGSSDAGATVQGQESNLSYEAYIFGGVDLNPFGVRTVNILGQNFNVPAKNPDFNYSTAQQHFNFPENPTVDSQLTNVIDAVTPAIITGNNITISAGPTSSTVTVTGGTPTTDPIFNNQIVVDGSDGGDNLVLNFSSGNFIAGNTLIYNGGDGKNTLTLEGGSFSSETITSLNVNSSTITLDSGTIDVNNVGEQVGSSEPTDGIVDSVPVTDFTFQSYPQPTEQTNVANGDVENGQQMTLIYSVQLISGLLNLPSEGFISVDFRNKADAFVKGSYANNVITLANPDPAYGMQGLVIDPGIGTDTVDVEDTAAGVNTEVTSEGGSDVVNVGDSNQLTGIQGPLLVDNPGGFTSLVIGDSADPNPESNVVISGLEVTGLSTGAIGYVEDGLSSLEVDAGSGGNQITVFGTPSSQFRGTPTTPQTLTTIDSGAGGDTVNVQDTGGNLIVDGEGGAGDTVNVGSLAPTMTGGTLSGIFGSVTVVNPSGATALNVDDSGDGTARPAALLDSYVSGDTFGRITAMGNSSPISYDTSGITALGINGGSGGNTLTVNFGSGNPIPSSGVSYNGRSGSGNGLSLEGQLPSGAWLNEVSQPSGPHSGTITLDGSQIAYTELSPITDTTPATNATYYGIANGGQIDIVNGPLVGGTQTTEINSGSSGAFELVDFANKSNVAVNGVGAGDTIRVGSATGTGGDIRFLTFPLSVYGGGLAVDKLIVDDSGDSTAAQYNVTGTTVARSGGGTITYSGFSQLTVNGSKGSDTLNVLSTLSATPVVINGNGAPDTFNVGSAANSLNGIQGAVTINGNVSAVDSLQINDQGDPSGHTYTITGSTVSRDGAATITYAAIANLTVNGAIGNDLFTTSGSIGSVTLAGGPGNDRYEFLTALKTSQYTIVQQPNASNDVVDFSRLPPTDPPASASDWIDLTGGATAYSLCSEPYVGTVMVGKAAPGQSPEQENLEYGLNITPDVDLSGVPNEAVPGEPLIFRYVDVGTKMTHTSSINWGDKTTTNPATANQLNGNPALVTAYAGLQGTVTLGHPFVTMKTYTVTFTVTNTNASVSPPASLSSTAQATVTIVTALVGPDPQRPGQMALFVGTSAAANDIALVQLPNGTIDLGVTSPPYSAVFSPSAQGHLYVYATTGSNAVTLGPTVTHDSVVYAMGPGDDSIVDAGSGNDRLYGGGSYNVIEAGSGSDIVYGGPGTNLLYAGTGNDVLVGGGTANYLYGGLGRDVLIGGPGQSFLFGDVGDDLLIAGTTSFDNNDAALTAILNEWASNNTFATRVGHLQGTIAGGANGAFLLTAGTVQTNGARNYLYAGLGQNWFFANPGSGLSNDIVVNKPTDLVTTI
jgi:Ca2+-binding RTX toxin-like protein